MSSIHFTRSSPQAVEFSCTTIVIQKRACVFGIFVECGPRVRGDQLPQCWSKLQHSKKLRCGHPDRNVRVDAGRDARAPSGITGQKLRCKEEQDMIPLYTLD